METTEENISAALAPFNEYDHDDGWWDWYQIGGRFTGIFDDYNPKLDPRNQEPCPFCAKVQGVCKQCNGSGIHTKWPTSWARYPGDITTPAQALSVLDERKRMGMTMVFGEIVFHRETWSGDKWWPDEEFDDKVRAMLESASPDCSVVAIDYHW